jgi:hypothetical protein
MLLCAGEGFVSLVGSICINGQFFRDALVTRLHNVIIILNLRMLC